MRVKTSFQRSRVLLMAARRTDHSPRLKSEGVILAAHPSGDADLVLRVLLKSEGKVSLLAKHARRSKKQYSGNFDLFDKGTFEYRPMQGKLMPLGSFVPTGSYPGLRTDLDKLTCASVLCECFDLLLREESGDGSEVFELFDLGVKAVEEAGDLKGMLKALYLTLAQLLRFTGFRHPPDDDVPSVRNLLSLLSLAEEHASFRLRTRGMVGELLKRLER